MITSALIAASLVVVPQCSWNKPGANPYRGSVPAAVDNYEDIPPEVRKRLRNRMEKRQYDEIADIRSSSIIGGKSGASYENLRDMHFGSGRICSTVSQVNWKEDAIERGLIYCEKEHCLIVPTVCNNVSRVTKIVQPPKPQPPSQPPASGSSTAPPSGIPNESGGAPSPDSFSSRALPPEYVPILPPPDTDKSFYPPVNPFPPYTPPGGGGGWVPPVLPPVPTPPVPEPSTWVLTIMGLCLIVWFSRKKAKATCRS